MRFMVIVKASKASESGAMPDARILSEMGRFNEELARAGVLLAGEGLHPSSRGARIRFTGDERTVVRGPFAGTQELVAGFWLIQAKDLDEAISWMRRCPKPHEEDCEIELRPVFEASDFADAADQELLRKEEELRARSGYAAHP